MGKLILNSQYQIYEKGGKVLCNSLQLADTFNKRHDTVLRTIEDSLLMFDKVNLHNFAEINFIKSDYRDNKNRKQPMYLMTRDGFSYIAMGFTGEEAAKFKVDYITRFSQMEAFIKSLLTTKAELHPALMDAIKESHEEPKAYHYSNEQNMIYRIVLGMDAKKYRAQHNLDERDGIKPHLSLAEVGAVEMLQRVDIGLIEAGLGYHQRQEALTNKYRRMNLGLAS